MVGLLFYYILSNVVAGYILRLPLSSYDTDTWEAVMMGG